METASVSSALLDQFYRLALLLAGNARTAEQVLAAVLLEMQAESSQWRNAASRQAWIACRIRQKCLRVTTAEGAVAPGLFRGTEETEDNPQLLAIEAYLLAQRFSCLAEPGRSALAFLYLDLFPPGELPALLDVSWEKLCSALAAARGQLRLAIQQMRSPESAPL